MQLTVYDGANTVGGNKILLEDNGVNLFFDFGINFHLRDQYFEEYLTEMMKVELVRFLGRQPYERVEGEESNHRNGYYPRTVVLKGLGEVPVEMLRDRKGRTLWGKCATTSLPSAV